VRGERLFVARGETGVHLSIWVMISTFICSSMISASTSCWYSFSVASLSRSFACSKSSSQHAGGDGRRAHRSAAASVSARRERARAGASTQRHRRACRRTARRGIPRQARPAAP
jgi:hypothetical protein